MEALKASFFPSLHIPTTATPNRHKLGGVGSSHKNQHRTHYSSCSFSSASGPCLKTNNRQMSSPTSTLVSSLEPDITSDIQEEEAADEEEKYDWFGQWYPITPTCDLDKRVPHARTVMGLDLVVWWDRNDAGWKVFGDTCPHRLAPLSQGRIDQWGRLQCVYHGWCFSGSGHCKFIPQAPPQGPPVHTFNKACVSVYPSTEQNGIVWFWPRTDPGFKDILSYKKPPYIPELDDPSFTNTMGVRDFPFGYEMLIENLMDPAHVPYAHFKLLPNPPSKSRVKLDREGGGPLDINILKLGLEGFSANRTGATAEFIAPCIYSSTFSLPSLKKNATDKGSMPQRRGMLLFYCVPVGPGKSRLIYTFPRNFGVWLNKIIPRWVFHLQQNLVLDSDLYLLHIEERKITDAGPSNWQKVCFVPTKSDGHVIAFRKWLRKYSDGQIRWEANFSGQLPPTPPKEQLMDRYRSHVMNCSSCNGAHKGLKAIEVVLQILPIVLIGTLAATKQSLTSAVARTTLALVAMLLFAASRWLAHFIYKNFHFHDYDHALL